MANPKLLRTCCQARWRPAILERKFLNDKSSSLNAPWVFRLPSLTAVRLYTTGGNIGSIRLIVKASLDLYARMCRIIPSVKLEYISPVLCTNRFKCAKALSIDRYNRLNVVADSRHSCNGRSSIPVLANVTAVGKPVSEMFSWIKTIVSSVERTDEYDNGKSAPSERAAKCRRHSSKTPGYLSDITRQLFASIASIPSASWRTTCNTSRHSQIITTSMTNTSV